MKTTSGIEIEGFRPLGKRLLVHLDPGLQVLPSGLYLPPDAQEIRSTGLVLASGPECPYPAGTRVLVSNMKGISCGWLQNTPVNLYADEDVQAVLEDDTQVPEEAHA